MAYSLRELHLAKNLEASAIKNLELALEAKDFIRDNFYNKDKGSFKSSNKVKLNNDPDLESTRLAHANDEVVEWSNGAQLKLARDQFWTAKGHNCDGLALMAHDWLAQTKSADVCMVEMGSRHIATVVGKLPDQSLPKDMTKWPADLSICDPWLNVACLAKDYPARFKEKMQKWSKDEKRIRVNDDWLLPNEPAWMSVINDKKTLWHPDNSIDPNLKEPRRECN